MTLILSHLEPDIQKKIRKAKKNLNTKMKRLGLSNVTSGLNSENKITISHQGLTGEMDVLVQNIIKGKIDEAELLKRWNEYREYMNRLNPTYEAIPVVFLRPPESKRYLFPSLFSFGGVIREIKSQKVFWDHNIIREERVITRLEIDVFSPCRKYFEKGKIKEIEKILLEYSTSPSLEEIKIKSIFGEQDAIEKNFQLMTLFIELNYEKVNKIEPVLMLLADFFERVFEEFQEEIDKIKFT